MMLLVAALWLISNQLTIGQCKEFATLDHIRTRTDPDVQKHAAEDLVHRLLQNGSQHFSISIDPDLGPRNRDTFKLLTQDGKLSVTGTSGIAAAWGVYYFLTQYCGCHVSWGGVQVKLPITLPVITKPVIVTSNDRFRYYQNVCTVSYSFAWWDWLRWEREIDWMALNGINLPLAFNGQEAIWQRVYMSMGFTQKEMDSHFGGPAFLAWSRMGNMRGWGGPLSSAWHDQQVALQHKILDRMRSLGIIPVLPAFAGHVPMAITKHFPNASISHLDDWGRFNKTYCCTALLDVNDPLFVQIGKAFQMEYKKEFGTDHIYNTDTFNEMLPKSSSPAYLHNASLSVYNAMLAGDPDAIWLMQDWLFREEGFWGPDQVKALLTAVPQGKMIILELFSEVDPIYPRTHSYYGQPFIWTMLHNFGGTVAMYGVVEAVNQKPFSGRSFPNSSMVGIGLTPEGINQNNVIYEFMMENSWRTKPRDIMAWASDYARRRYGHDNQLTSQAWRLFMSGIYNGTSYHNGERDIFLVTRPVVTSPSRQSNGVYNGTHYYDLETDVFLTRRPLITSPSHQAVWYNIKDFFTGWDYMLQASSNFTDSNLYRYDLVDVCRQSLQLISIEIYTQLITAYKNKDIHMLKSSGAAFVELLSDMDDLLATDEHFLLGRWLEAAKTAATTSDDRKLFEYNARIQVTIWGPNAEILDYANKQWSGLINGYYKPRWQLFVSELARSLYQGIPFNQTQYKLDVFRLVEYPFTVSTSLYPNTTRGDQIEMAHKIHKKYRPVTLKHAKFFKKLPKLSKKGRRFTKQATRWMRKNQPTSDYIDSWRNDVDYLLNLKYTKIKE